MLMSRLNSQNVILPFHLSHEFGRLNTAQEILANITKLRYPNVHSSPDSKISKRLGAPARE